MNIIKAYQYLFYILYKFYDSVNFKWMSEWKAFNTIVVLNFILFFTIVGYIDILTGIDIIPKNPFGTSGILIFIVITGLIVMNYKLFYQMDKWKKS